jgi:predicted amidophosphoribosyltransferase
MSSVRCTECSAKIPDSVMLCRECGHPFSHPPSHSRSFFGRVFRLFEAIFP